MKQQTRSFLNLLNDARVNGNEWVGAKSLTDAGIPYHTRTLAEQNGYVETRGSRASREYRVLAHGKKALELTLGNTLSTALRRSPTNLDLENMTEPTGDEPQAAPAQVTTPMGYFPKLDDVIRPGFRPESNGSSTRNINSIAKPIVQAAPLSTEKNNVARTRACVQAIDILSEDWPEVNDLVDVLMKLNQRKAQSHE